MPFVVAPLVVYLAFFFASGSVGDVDDLPHLELVPTGNRIGNRYWSKIEYH